MAFDLTQWLNQVVSSLTGYNSPAVQNQPQAVQKQQVGWNDAPNGQGGYLPVFNTDPNPTAKYKYQPQPAQASVVTNTPSPINQQVQQILGMQTPKPTLAPDNRSIQGFTNWNPPMQYANLVNQAGSKYGIPPAFIAGIIQNENGAWNPNVKPNYNKDANGNILSTDRGFGQISDVSHPEITNQQASDPAFVINFIANHLAQKYKETSSWPQTFASYNVGNMVGTGPDSGRDANGLGPAGKAYLNNALKNIDPALLKQYGLQTQY